MMNRAADIVRSYRMKMACEIDNGTLEECAEEIEALTPEQGLRDAIRLAIAEDDPSEYPVVHLESMDGDTSGTYYGLSDAQIDRCADIAYATIVNQLPAASVAEQAGGGKGGVDRLEEFLSRHSEWSQSAFGTDSVRGPRGPLKHLVKEITTEILPDCDDIVEFADAFMLLMDALRRAGFGFNTLLGAAEEKLIINQSRTWPAAGSDDLVEHIKDSVQPDTRLRWTSELPTEPGYYWRKNQVDTIDMIAITNAHDHLDYMIFGLSGTADRVKNMAKTKYQFAGPIPEREAR